MANVRYPMKIDAPTFQEFREQFNAQLKNLFFQMVEDKVEQAQISCKFDIRLADHAVQDPDTGEMTDILSPVIAHKITTTIQHKTEETGGFGSLEYQLVWSKQRMQYEMVSVKQSQKSLFDDGYDYVEETEEEEDDG